MKTNLDLVEYAKRALNEKWGYVWGTFGQTLTPALLNSKAKQYPYWVGRQRDKITRLWMGRRVTDCVGLIKSCCWYNENTKRIEYNGNMDVTADGMYSRAKKKGNISSIPEIPGICVGFKGHIGVYIGNGWVIEAKSTSIGVVKTRLREGAWKYWLECPFIDYSNKEIKENKTEEELEIVNTNIELEGKNQTVRGINHKEVLYVSIEDLLGAMGFMVMQDKIKNKVVARLPEVEIKDLKTNKVARGKAFNLRDRNYVEFRKVLEDLGYKVGWIQDTKQITIE